MYRSSMRQGLPSITQVGGKVFVFFGRFFYLIYVGVWLACMLCAICMQNPRRPEAGTRASGTGVTDKDYHHFLVD